MEAQKLFVRPDNTVIIQCPSCSLSKEVPAEKLVNGKRILQIKCSCQSVFKGQLETRKKFRRPSNLEGHFRKLSNQKNPDNYHSVIHYGAEKKVKPVANCTVENISVDGLGLSAKTRPTVKPGDILRVEFTLDNANQTEIVKQVIVRMVNDNYIGCEFQDNSSPDKNIGFYLL